MAELKERLRADLNAAMRARDQVRMRTLRLALTSITNEEVAGASARDLTDDEVVKVLTREARKRREAAEAFSAAGRSDQAAAERAEGACPGRLPPGAAQRRRTRRLGGSGDRRDRSQRHGGHGPGHEDGDAQGRGPGRRRPGRRRGPPPPVRLAGQAGHVRAESSRDGLRPPDSGRLLSGRRLCLRRRRRRCRRRSPRCRRCRRRRCRRRSRPSSAAGRPGRCRGR